MKVAIQGTHGSFHEMAAQRVFSDTDFAIVGCDTFRDVFDAVQDNNAVFGVIAVENSLHGSINAVYKLLAERKLFVFAEVRLPIELYLIGHPNMTLAALQSGDCEVLSQREALSQCETWLTGNLPKAHVTEYHDTAAAVVDVLQGDQIHRVAVASKAAASRYAGALLAGPINDEPENYTRFFAITKNTSEPKHANRTSIILDEKTDQAGKLHSALALFTKYDINLSKLHSHPISGKKRLYNFYVDFDTSASRATQLGIFAELKNQGWRVTILGSYVADDISE